MQATVPGKQVGIAWNCSGGMLGFTALTQRTAMQPHHPSCPQKGKGELHRPHCTPSAWVGFLLIAQPASILNKLSGKLIFAKLKMTLNMFSCPAIIWRCFIPLCICVMNLSGVML